MQTVLTGARTPSRAHLQARRLEVPHEQTITRKQLAQAALDCEKALELRPTLRQVLHALVSVWGEEAVEGRLLVWPSNDYIMTRTGLSERAVRICLGQLSSLQVVTPKDSANGKRFAVKRGGVLLDAFGFDLTPLAARAAEFAGVVLLQRQEAERRRRAYDEITICRRAAEAAIAAMEPRNRTLEERFEDLVAFTPRRNLRVDPTDVLDAWRALRAEAELAYEKQGDGGISCRHIEDNNEPPREPWNNASRDEAGASLEPSLELIADACPALTEFYGRPRAWPDLVTSGSQIRSMLGASPSAWNNAVTDLGMTLAAVISIWVFQKHVDDVARGQHKIKSTGAYFVSMVRLAAENRLDLTKELELMKKGRAH